MNKSSGVQLPSWPLNSGGVTTSISGLASEDNIPILWLFHLMEFL
jgi:hypothetical protein